MSLDIFVMRMNGDDMDPFPLTLFEEIMMRDAISPKLPLTNIEYEDSWSEVYVDETEFVSCVMFTHFDGDTFYQRVWELLDRTGSFLLWPGRSRSLAVTDAKVLETMPPAMVKQYGPSFIVHNGEEVLAALNEGMKFPDEL